MKINFCDNLSIKDAIKTAIVIIDVDQTSNSKLEFVDFAKKNSQADGGRQIMEPQMALQN